MTDTRRCPQCGAELAADAPEGLCPQCLLIHGIETQPPSDSQEAAGSNSDRGQAYSGPFTAPTPDELARHFPQLEIIELLGQGGMGAVYKARQPELDRLVAVKILPSDAARDPAFAQRFHREARALAKLNHPNVVQVYGLGQTPSPPAPLPQSGARGELEIPTGEATGQAKSPLAPAAGSGVSDSPLAPAAGRGVGGEGSLYYFIMEYVEGVNLRQLLKSGQCKPEEALKIVPQICEALQFAHDEGIVHRDIKPENILLDKRGRVKIADFGLAKLLGRGAGGSPATPGVYTLTGPWQVMGTPNYMAPEQFDDPLKVDHRADIYALGVVFYEMLTGEIPRGRFPPPSEKVQIDVRLDEVVLRSLEKEPERRYQQASEVKTDVETITGTAQLPASHARTAFARAAPETLELGRFLVRGPSTGMIFTGYTAWIQSLAFAVCWILLPAQSWDSGLREFAPWVGVLGVPYGALLLAGGWQLRRLRAYPFVLLSAIVALVPFPPLVTFVGLPIGIWTLVVLMKSATRSAFELELQQRIQAVQAAAAANVARPESAKGVGLRASPLATPFADSGRATQPAPPEAGRQIENTEQRIELARERVKGPALGLLVAGAFAFVSPILFTVGLIVSRGEMSRRQGYVHTGSSIDWIAIALGMMNAVVTCPLAVVTIVGALCMKKLMARWLALTASILAVLPLSVTWLVGLPLGIWSLVVLNKREVEEAFHARTIEPETLRTQFRRLGLAHRIIGILAMSLSLVLMIGYVILVVRTVPPGGELFLGLAGILVFTAIFFVTPSVLLAVGARKMQRLESHAWAVAVSLLVMLTVIGLPLGLWTLALLLRSDARQAFPAGGSPTRPQPPAGDLRS